MGQVTFNRQFDLNIDGTACLIEKSNGYIIPFNSYHNPLYKPFTVQLINLAGESVDSVLYGNVSSNSYYEMTKIIQVNDSNYIIGAYSRDSFFYANISLVKINQFGDSIWSQSYHPDSAFAYATTDLILSSDSGYVISGQKYDTSHFDGQAYVIKFDKFGTIQWDTQFGGSKFDAFEAIIETNDLGFLALGWTRSFGFGNSNNRDFYLVKMDSLGNFQWQKTYGTTENETGFRISALSDGNYIILGHRALNSVNSGWIMKIDPTGNIIWSKTINPLEEGIFCSGYEISNSNIVCVGASRDPASHIDGGTIFSLDSLGNLQWFRRFAEGSSHSILYDVRVTNDGGLICPGLVFKGQSGNQDAWVVKTDSLGCDSSDCAGYTLIDEINTGSMSISIFPNPASDLINFEVYESVPSDFIEIQIFNVMGQIKLNKKIICPCRHFSISLKDFSAGIYLIKGTNGKTEISTRLVKN